MKKNQARTAKSKPSGARRSSQDEGKRLRREIKELKAERDQYKKSLIALLHEGIPINKKELLALARSQPPFEGLLAQHQADRG